MLNLFKIPPKFYLQTAQERATTLLEVHFSYTIRTGTILINSRTVLTEMTFFAGTFTLKFRMLSKASKNIDKCDIS